MRDAVIVSTARTPIGKAYRGAFNTTHGAALGGHVIKHAVARAGIDPGEVEDVMLGETKVMVGGGLESISLVQDNSRQPVYEDWLKEHKPQLWMPMIETADNVAARYGVSREAQDAFALESQRRTASAQQARRFDD